MTKRPALEALDAAMLNPVRVAKRWRYRLDIPGSIINGQWVSKDYARVNPGSTTPEAATMKGVRP